MRRADLFHALLIGVVIAVLLSALALAQMAWWPPRTFDLYAGVAGLLFLLVGLGLGLRPRRAATAPIPVVTPAPAMEPLSPRETEVLLRLAEGCSNREIAARHFVSENTVKTQVRQVCEKLGANSRLRAVARARELGLLAAAQIENPGKAAQFTPLGDGPRQPAG